MTVFLSAVEASKQSGISEKTIRKWIRQGRLKATERLVDGRRVFAIRQEDLEAVLRDRNTIPERSDTLAERVERLERTVSTLQRQIEMLTADQAPTIAPAPRKSGPLSAPAGDVKSTLPPGYIGFREMARRHNISISTVQKALDSARLVATEGQWIVGRASVRQAFDREEQEAFVRMYGGREDFQQCDDPECPCHQPYKKSQML